MADKAAFFNFFSTEVSFALNFQWKIPDMKH